MKNIWRFLGMVLIGSALPAMAATSVERLKCIETAKNYAKKHRSPWSDTAKYDHELYDSCYVDVSAENDHGYRCSYFYVVNKEKWEVTMIESLSPACQPY